MKDLVIIGAGPAGISAALYAVRGGAKTTVIAKDGGALEKADAIQNYYGFPEGISAKELIARGVKQAANLGATIVRGEVVGVGFGQDGYTVKTAEAAFDAGAVIIACGVARNAPPVANLARFEGSGVSYCAVCDGFFFRGKRIAVIGSGKYAASEYDVLKDLAKSAVLLTNGEDPAFDARDIPVDKRKLASLEGDGAVQEVHFADGSALPVDGVFIACGFAGAFELSKKLGLELTGGKIAVDEKRATNIPGIFAAGDCTAGMQQIAKAVCDGMIAGTEALRYLKANG